MSTKTKNDKANINLTELAQQAGIVLMTVAATVGLLELPEHPNARIVVPNQPSLVAVGVNNEGGNNPLRREREETAPHHISYSEIQRTPGRTGKF
ncbi:MAG: hypothetical protein JWL89_123 [Candidatus Saccharibacteria bacterium]|nr:hypothetical protein [Candidatus Saccharibacteria bacterium]